MERAGFIATKDDYQVIETLTSGPEPSLSSSSTELPPYVATQPQVDDRLFHVQVEYLHICYTMALYVVYKDFKCLSTKSIYAKVPW